jgi:8-oxo-dGTP diphosphatase
LNTTSTTTEPHNFHGAKVALLCGDHVVTLLRDDTPGLAFANMWDLPGGGREGSETAEETVLREVHEEIGLHLPVSVLAFRSVHRSDHLPGAPTVLFFAGNITQTQVASMVLGDEGQALRLMPIAEFLSRSDAIPSLQSRLKRYLSIHADGSTPSQSDTPKPGR